ncbi:MAG TPA: cyclic nucleotide-binding domain-containing protein [Casimicrobiaceae bacterium]|nr:cyclic nucleotide-binding domain-containing protein [Casimicrobiaceae bacterium]
MDVFQEAEMLRNVPLFGGLSPAQLKLLAFTGSVLRFEPGDVLMQQGDPADSAYVILEGTVEVVGKTKDGGEFVIAVQGKNSVMGEMGVICDAPRSATVRAKDAVRALRISGDVFLRLACESPQRALYVMRELSTRLAQELMAHARLREQLQSAQSGSN